MVTSLLNGRVTDPEIARIYVNYVLERPLSQQSALNILYKKLNTTSFSCLVFLKLTLNSMILINRKEDGWCRLLVVRHGPRSQRRVRVGVHWTQHDVPQVGQFSAFNEEHVQIRQGQGSLRGDKPTAWQQDEQLLL